MKNDISFLMSSFEEKWTGLRFVSNTSKPIFRFDRICQAVDHSFNNTFAISTRTLECQGSIRCLQISDNTEAMINAFHSKINMNLDIAKKITEGIPIRNSSEEYIEFGNIEQPDVYVSYLYPESAMKILRQWQLNTGSRLNNPITSFASVCSSVVDALNRNSIVFSVGCPESRRVGGIGKEQMAAIVPSKVVCNIL